MGREGKERGKGERFKRKKKKKKKKRGGKRNLVIDGFTYSLCIILNEHTLIDVPFRNGHDFEF